MALFTQIKSHFSKDQIYNRNNGIFSKDQFRKMLDVERERVGRNQQQFSLILIDSSDFSQNSQKIYEIVKKIKNRTRLVDTLGWYDNKHIGLILPYTSRAGALKLSEHLIKDIAIGKSRSIVDIYTYPGSKEF